MQLCQVDSNLIFTGKTSPMTCVDGVLPRGYIYADPPKTEGIWQWQSTKWGKLSQYPSTPAPAEKVPTTKEEYQKVATDAGYWDALIAVVDERIALALKADPKEPIKP